jgi:sensor domain CHASE-containing protein
MSRTGWLVSALMTALLAALIAWFMGAVEWVDVDVPRLPRGEAARDRFYVAKQLARQLGASGRRCAASSSCRRPARRS